MKTRKQPWAAGVIGAVVVGLMGPAWCLAQQAGKAQTATPTSAHAPAAKAAATPSDDATFRPTVLIRKGSSQGSGTIFASIDGETLILTVAHVVSGPGELTVELHRYNLGMEHAMLTTGWPRVLHAEIVGMDQSADIAILRIKKMVGLPYVARLARAEDDITPGTVVTSVGIDKGAHLSSWVAHVDGMVSLDPKGDGKERPYLITDRAPEHGRSGGGLFLNDGRLVGLCVGRVERRNGKGREIGVFAPLDVVRRLIAEHQLEKTMTLSDNRHAGIPTASAPLPPRPRVTETKNRQPPPQR